MTLPFDHDSEHCRAAQRDWAALPERERLRPVAEFRHLVATDLLPTAAAAKFLLAEAERVLRTTRPRGRPLWLLGTRDAIHRRPHGVVGLIGTWNYPIFLTAVPVLHALVAGNGVLWKPSELTPKTAEVLYDLFLAAGFSHDLLAKLPGTREAGPQLADADIDFLHFTGSEAVGRKIAARLGERLIPSALELSGVDAMFVFPGADAKLAARSAWYGATFNAGQTCLACRRAFVQRSSYAKFVDELRPLVESARPVWLALPSQLEQADRLLADAARHGADVLQTPHPPAEFPGKPGGTPMRPAAVLNAAPDLAICREASFAPVLAVIPFDDVDDAVRMHESCRFGLGASAFGATREETARLAPRLSVGMILANDVLAPTAHPATPFGGRRASGWGVTQGADGLLQMTVPQVVSERSGSFRPHVDAGLTGDPAAADVVRGLLAATHGRTLGQRWRGFKQTLRGLRRTGAEPGEPGA